MSSKQQYKDYCKPKLTELFESLGLDRDYRKASGNYLITDDGKEVLDCISGFGSAIAGHNHPVLISALQEALSQNIPIVAQGSILSDSAMLAERLNTFIPNGGKYFVNYSNSGAESVEAALKHAYKVHYDRMLREYERLTRLLNDFYYQYEHDCSELELPGGKDLIDFRDDLDEYNLAQFEAFQNKPVMLSFKGAYHGKTSASLKITFNKSFREPFEGLSAIKPIFIDPNKPERIPEILQEEISTFYYPIILNDKIELRPIRMTRVMGIIFELIMGEGGIMPLPDSTLAYLAEKHSELGLPYIIDEIQTGCGRLGEIFSYSKTALARIDPEYILLSKSLGGGISKIGATLIKREIYDQDFGILHTSTFGEDKLSSYMANKVLDLLTENDSAMLKGVYEKSDYLITRLKAVQQAFPDVIKDVRGKGLMIGIEFSALDDQSPFFRAAGKQGVLSLLVASYLMHYFKIRVLAPISTMLKGNPGKKRLSIVRIQPAAIIEKRDMDLLVESIHEVCNIIHCNNEYCFVAHLIGEKVEVKDRKQCMTFAARWPMNDEYRHIDARVGFVLHPTTVGKLIEYYFPSFEAYKWTEQGLKDWWNKLSRFLEPVHVKNEYITSNDFVVEMALVFVPYLPEYITKASEPYLQKEIRDKVQDAVTIARELGDDNIPVSMVGLGAYTSIATRNGETVNHYEIPITTGNAYTVGLTVQGIIYAAQKRGVKLSTASIAVVGAGGNIGSVLAQVLAPRIGKLTLVGSGKGTQSRFRLQFTRKQCVTEIIKEFCNSRTGGDGSQNHLGLFAKEFINYLKQNASELYDELVSESEDKSEFINKAADLIPDSILEKYIAIETDFNTLKQADIVIAATNSADEALLKPEHVKEDAIVCGTSVPTNLSNAFKNHKRILAFDGGFARLPEDSEINFVGMPNDGMAYGCLAETLVLGFDGQNNSFSKGELMPKQVFHIMDAAQMHGFDLGSLKLDNEQLTV